LKSLKTNVTYICNTKSPCLDYLAGAFCMHTQYN